MPASSGHKGESYAAGQSPCAAFICCRLFRLYEEVEPSCILDSRTALEGQGKEYLVQYKVRHTRGGAISAVPRSASAAGSGGVA